MYQYLICLAFHRAHHVFYEGQRVLCLKCDKKGGPGVRSGFGTRLRVYGNAV